jgi:predicted 3-demethylubiquinone-9 3-methyltransferase (glyoxalase superfamily)
MPKITTFLMFDNQAEEAMNFYTSVFPNSKVTGLMRDGDKVMGGSFELDGQELLCYNGGPDFKFEPGLSLFVYCESQAEIDDLWTKLLAGGGQEVQCGWLTDRFGVSWQIVPTVMMEMLQDRDPEKVKRAKEAMMTMVKFDIKALQDAYEGVGTTSH